MSTTVGRWYTTPGDGDHWEHLGSARHGTRGGKYLCFSKDRTSLKRLARWAVGAFRLRMAKVSTPMHTELVGAEDFVCCLYDTRYRAEVESAIQEKAARTAGIRYARWKTNADTLARTYSRRFLDAMNNRKGEWA
jgi:hypothetical protein